MVETQDSGECVTQDEGASQERFHVVAVGASAGGLEALEQFFQPLPLDSGMAYVVIQHLSPDFKSHMEELIARKTKVPVNLVKDGTQVQPNQIYLLPAKMEMSIARGRLRLKKRNLDRSLSHPIDQFFSSLAQDCGSRAIGVVLSGTGSDGSQGVRDIHLAGGLVLSQDQASAKFNGMPLSAQATGVVDLVLPPEQMVQSLVTYSRTGIVEKSGLQLKPTAGPEAHVDRIFDLLNRHFAIDFSQYKSTTVGRRLSRRVALLGLKSLEAYVDHLHGNHAELNNLYRDLLIGVTSFFRDPEAFAILAEVVIPRLFSEASNSNQLRVWVAGCASGEEVYSVAILLDEERRRRKSRKEIKLFATDAHPSSIQVAARGFYPEQAVSELTQDRRSRYFRREGNGIQVVPELRRTIVFAPHNVVSDAPFTQMDLVTCRNLLIYLRPTAQQTALSMFHFALRSRGYLFLGPSESPGELQDEFAVVDLHSRIYSKRRDVRLPIGTPLPSSQNREKMTRLAYRSNVKASSQVDSNLLEIYDELLEQKLGPSILVNRMGEIVHIFSGAERYLKYAGGRPSSHILDAIDERLKPSLSAAIQHATKKNDIVRYVAVPIQTDEGIDEPRIAVEPIGDPIKGSGNLLVSIHKNLSCEETGVTEQPAQADELSVDMTHVRHERLALLESELRYSQENLQATIEEMETSNEELQASNEELVASNEELQSTNEELHSVNEELYSVNAEHQRRVEELAEANADMDNLLATTRVGVVFLDGDLNIRRATPQIAEVLRLENLDIGSPIAKFAQKLHHDELQSDLLTVLESQQELERRVYDDTERPHLLRMVPYRSGDRIEGVVLTMIDIASLAAAEAELERFKFMTETAIDMIALADPQGRLIYVNPSMCKSLRYERGELLNMCFYELAPSSDLDSFSKLFREASLARVKPFQGELTRGDGQRVPVEMSVASVEMDRRRLLCANIRDITERRASELEMRLQYYAIESTLNGIVITDPTKPENPITYVNPGFLQLTGYDRSEVMGKNCRLLQGEHSDPDVVEQIATAIREGRACRVALLNYRKDGTPFWNDLQITPVFDEHQRLVSFVGVQNDITDRMQAQQALEIAQQESQRASEAKSAFMANMSHELRTPMTAVLGFADMLGEELSDPSHIGKVETIKRNGEYLLALLNDILDLSKIEAGQLKIERHTLNVKNLIEEVHTLMDIRAVEEGIPLYVDWNPAIPLEITADETRVRQVLVNLISNALKFTDHGEVRIGVDVNQQEGQPILEISVTDTGIGIYQQQLSELFKPFSQTGFSQRRRFGGTGLGLSISKRLAEGMGGAISVESEPGVGSRFTLSLPLSAKQLEKQYSSPALALAPTSSPVVAQEALPTIESRILLADDRRDIWRIGKYFLEKAGATVTVVEDGLQAVEETERAARDGRPFDLIIMDMQMPVMTGPEAVAELRQAGFDRPIIALTADVMDGEREACIAMGCNDYFPKPINGSGLVKLVAMHLGAR